MKRNDNNNDGWRVRNNKILAMRNCCPLVCPSSSRRETIWSILHFHFTLQTQCIAFGIAFVGLVWLCLFLLGYKFVVHAARQICALPNAIPKLCFMSCMRRISISTPKRIVLVLQNFAWISMCWIVSFHRKRRKRRKRENMPQPAVVR